MHTRYGQGKFTRTVLIVSPRPPIDADERKGALVDEPSAGRPATWSRYAVAAFLPAVVAAAVICLVVAAVGLAQHGTLHPLVAVGAVAAIVGTGFAPISAIDANSYAEIYLDSAVLIVLALMVPADEAVVIFAVGQVLSLVALRVNVYNFLINSAMAVLGSSAALAVFGALRGAPGTPREIGAVLATSATYALITLLVTAGGACNRGMSVRSGLRRTFRVSVTVGALVIDSLGYLAAVLERTSVWALVLMAGPVALLTVTSRVLHRAQRDRARLRELVSAADQAHTASDVGEVVEVLLRQAEAMLGCLTVELRDRPPTLTECGAALTVDGSEKWLVAVHRPAASFRSEDRQAMHALVRMAQAVLANRELLEGASYQALHDPLTGLANRALFAETLAGELRRAVRTAEPLAVVFLDLDGFKPVNDELGHEAGDALLVETARRLQGGVRASDLVARVGGDEFCVLLPAVNTRTDALRVASNLCRLVQAPYTLPSGVVRVSVSAGVAIGCADGSDAGELMRKADQAMYLAKRRGTGDPVSWTDTVSSGASPVSRRQ
jgi:diguanylate cyclase (GGDEF)-like protein